MSLAHLNRAQAGDPADEKTGVPDPQFVPGNTVFGNRYPKAFKLKVLQETDACTKPGELGRYLRQHGLTHTTLTCFRKQRASGALAGPASQPTKSRTPANLNNSDESKRLMELERENRKLRRQLEQAEVIIDIQKKVARLLEIPLDEPPTRRSNRSVND
jgi:transposase-like protein